MSLKTNSALRHEMVKVMRAMADQGLNRGACGNLSVRFDGGLLVTPGSLTPDAPGPESMVRIDAAGTVEAGALRPSSECRTHLELLARRPDGNAVARCHSRHATILAGSYRPIPTAH